MTRSAVDDAERLPAPPLRTDAESAQAMARVLARPELLRTHVEEHWELRRSRDEAPEPDGTWPWLHTLAGVLARGLEVGLWAVAALAIAVLMYVILERKPALRARRSAAAAVPVPARVRPGAAPAPPLPTREVVAKALALLAEGQDVKALSVLYVGTLTALLRQDGLALPPQATEGQCLAAVRTAPVSAERRSLFVEVTALWQSSAYAHVRPERGRLEEICERFTACFGNTR